MSARSLVVLVLLRRAEGKERERGGAPSSLFFVLRACDARGNREWRASFFDRVGESRSALRLFAKGRGTDSSVTTK